MEFKCKMCSKILAKIDDGEILESEVFCKDCLFKIALTINHEVRGKKNERL